MESVLSENEELRQAQLERLRQQDSGLGPMGPLNAELLAEMNERVEVTSIIASFGDCYDDMHNRDNRRW